MKPVVFAGIGITVLALVGLGVIAQAQTVSQVRTDQTNPRVIAALTGEPSLAQLRSEVVALKAEIAALKSTVTAQENARKSLATQHFAVSGKVNKLWVDYYSHQHHQNWLSVANRTDGAGVNMSVGVMQVSPPISTCTSKAPTPGKPATALRWDDRYNCAPPS